jgi:flavin reductase (DIM6/NTAB) family NADH-FMN oxidoreductase RutF
MMDDFTPDADSQRAFRDTLAQYATGVTVVTCLDAQGPLAMTANSFASVSLDPPLVLWSPARASARHDSFADARHFAIHVLRDTQIDLGTRFARDGRAFEGLDWSRGPDGVPLLPDCLARFVCARFATHPAGDHTIVLGQVTHCACGTGDPLVFAQGAYGRFTDGI